IVDREDRIVVYMAGQPRGDATWPETVKQAGLDMEAAVSIAGFPESPKEHPRGRHNVLNIGFSHGGGPKAPYPTAVKNSAHGHAMQCLHRSRALYRIAGFASSALCMGAPCIFGHYVDVLGKVKRQRPDLKHPFENSIFPTATFNFGPCAIAFPHRDAQNIPYGWCAITALGNFDPKVGGHLYLWELKLIVEFPPGSTILIPSAVVTHGNTPIQEGKTRQSFTQYCAGALMRWQGYGFRTEAEMEEEDPALHSLFTQSAPSRWKEALGYFSKCNELEADHAVLRASRASS
ncbi:hypothetical protein BV25DRAFT_1816620, partial [Artomyces pyxidatus]